MARRKNGETAARNGRAEHFVTTAVGAAEALSVGVLRLTERTLIEAIHVVEDVGSELTSAVARAARGSVRAAEDIGGDLMQVGRGGTRGVTEPARQIGDGVARLATGLWRKAPAKAAAAKTTARRGRRRSAA